MWLIAVLGCSEYQIDDRVKNPDLPEPDIEVTPDYVRFESIPPGCVSEQSVTVSNVGESLLEVDGSWIEGDASLSAFWLASSLEPGASSPVTIRFAPTIEGGVTGALVVASNDPDEPEAGSNAEGIAEGTADILDRYIQESQPVDVMWVIDNSGSMAQEQARVIADIEEFYTWFTTLGLDFHMGVITTDILTPTMGGRLQGSPAYITESTSNGLAELAEALNVGTEDQGDESGLAAMQLALSEPVRSTENAGFVRDDAQLVISFLTDEPEQSGVASADYIAFLQTIKADPDDITVSAIVGDRDAGCATTCDGAANDAQPGNAYLDVVDAFGGVFGSICTCDLSDILASIGLESTLYAREFALTTLPADSAQITVYIDGAETLDWTYDADANVIVLGTPPTAGQVVEILYPAVVACPE